MFNKLWIKFKIYKVKRHLYEMNYNFDILFYIYIKSLNNRFFDGKLDVEKEFEEFKKLKEIQKKDLIKKLNDLEKNLLNEHLR